MKKIILLAALPVIVFTSCKNNNGEVATQAREQQMTIDSLKTEIMKKQVIDSMNRVATIPVYNAPMNDSRSIAMPAASPVASPYAAHTYHAATHKRVRHTPRYSGYSNNSYAGNYNDGNHYYAQPAQQKTKKGWNSKLKGSVIGAGAGAIAGALIDHKKGRGAILGGLLGGGAGLGIGALLDRRSGN